MPATRRRGAKEIAQLLEPGLSVALTTHVNADGDGVGSEIALWHLLANLGLQPRIANPTPVPERFGFLFQGSDGADVSARAVQAVSGADVIVVLDISDLDRLGHLAGAVAGAGVPTVCIDHHASRGTLPAGPALVDPAAAATGELVYDLALANGWPISAPVARGLYVALLTDTGGFRFSNTTPRALRVAANLLEHGLDPEEIYSQVYASIPEGRVRLLTDILQTLVVEDPYGLAWMSVPAGALERREAVADDLDGVVEYARSIRGVRLAILFRQLAGGRIKVSFRSVGTVDVAALAREFGGGGHTKAAGASLAGTLDDVQTHVLQRARDFLAGEPGG